MEKFFERYEELVIANHHLKHEVKDLQREIIDLRAEIFTLKKELCEVKEKEDTQEPDEELIVSTAEQAYVRALQRSPEDRKASSDTVYAVKETRTSTGCTAKQAKEAVEVAKRNHELTLKSEQEAQAQASKMVQMNIPGVPPEILATIMRK